MKKNVQHVIVCIVLVAISSTFGSTNGTAMCRHEQASIDKSVEEEQANRVRAQQRNQAAVDFNIGRL